jgi:periplasmic protein TonB
MKNQESNAPQMDEIVFEKRNKMYGAFILRKMYNRQLTKALLLASAIMIAGLAYPLVSSYNAKNEGRYVLIDYIYDPLLIDPPKAEPPVIPPAPPDNSEIQKQIRFIPPQIVDGYVPEDNGFLPMDEMNKIQTNIFIDITPEAKNEKQPDVLDIPESKKEIFITAEEMPTFTGGETERLRFLHDNIQYPQLAAETAIQGTVYIRFVVDSKGNITDAFVLRGIGGGCDEEALRVINAMPQWHPGKQNGKAVRVIFTMPIMFKLQNN